MGPFVFDRDRLLNVDKLRHEVVHRVGPTAAAALQDSELVYLGNTGLFLGKLLGDVFGIALDDALCRRFMTES